MYRYLIISGDLKKEIMDIMFPENYPLHEGNVWAVKSPMTTTSDVSEFLGFNAEENGRSGVVVKIDDYHGCYDRGLWEKLDAWSRL